MWKASQGVCELRPVKGTWAQRPGEAPDIQAGRHLPSRVTSVCSHHCRQGLFSNWSAHRGHFTSHKGPRELAMAVSFLTHPFSKPQLPPHYCAHTSKHTVPWTGPPHPHWLRITSVSGFCQASDGQTGNPHHYLLLWSSAALPKGAIWKFVVVTFGVLTIGNTSDISELGRQMPAVLQCLG